MIEFQEKSLGSRPYFLSLSYLWKGKVHKNEYKLPFSDRKARLSLSHPPTIYPGQEVEIEVQASTQDQRPIPNLDVLAYGLTSQFEEYQAPALGDISNIYPDRKSFNDFSDHKINQASVSKPLTYESWNQNQRLDSISMYQFLYPKNGMYEYRMPSPDKVSQIAPFVVDRNAQILPIHIIYVDRVPVFFRGAKGWVRDRYGMQDVDEYNRYSFFVDSGYHNIQLRTRNRLVEIDSVYVSHGEKLILCASTFFAHPNKRVIGKPSELTNSEVAYLAKYMLRLKSRYYEPFTYLKQEKMVVPVVRNGYLYHDDELLLGLFRPDILHFHVPGKFETSVGFESGYTYEFRERLVKMKEWTSPSLQLPPKEEYQDFELLQPSFADVLLTEVEIDQAWKQAQFEEVYAPIKYRYPQYTAPGFGQMQVAFQGSFPIDPQAVILISRDSLNFIRNISPQERLFNQLAPAAYDLLVFQSDSSYFRFDSLRVEGNGANLYPLSFHSPLTPDSLLAELFQLASKREVDLQGVEQDKLHMRTLYEQKFYRPMDEEGLEEVTGVIRSRNGEPLIGVRVAAVGPKGLISGALTDENGNFRLKALPNGKLSISYIGFESEEIKLRGQREFDIYLEQLPVSMDAVEISAKDYKGDPARMAMGSASGVRSVQGIAALTAGVYQGEDGESISVRAGRSVSSDYYIDGVRVRGLNSLEADEQPLVVITGGTPAEFGDIDPEQIEQINVLKDASATAIYGARGANGVIIVSLKGGGPNTQILSPIAEDTGSPLLLPQGASSLRSDFRDYAFWEPKLKTDRQGKARFTTRFPDDITQWRTFVLAMGKGKYIGQTESAIQAYKPVQARLSLPRFMVEGDSVSVIGKVQNFVGDTVQLVREFAVESDTIFQRPAPLFTSVLDTIPFVAPEADSLTLTYRIEDPNGYEDGEKRSIPIMRKGSPEIEGHFLYLNHDTTVQLQFDPAKGPVRLHAEGNWLELLRTDIWQLHTYAYTCNEQTASKLKGLLYEQQIAAQLNEPFSHRNTIQKLIRRLQNSQGTDGLWGWWPKGEGELWITQHVVEALLLAKEMEYPVTFQKQNLRNALVFEASQAPRWKQLRTYLLMKQMGVPMGKAKLQSNLDSLARDTNQTSLQGLHLMQVRQVYGLPIELDSLWKSRQTSLRGNWYWQGKGWSVFHDNDLLLTLKAYEILKTAKVSEDTLLRVRNYFLEHRAQYRYWNTYQTAEVLASILPDVLGEANKMEPMQLMIRGKQDIHFDQFPLDTILEFSERVSLQKSGTGPMYLSLSQSYHNNDPAPIGEDMRISTWLGSRTDSVSELKGGVPISLHATVSLAKDADYVMIELPIPAACTYANKNQSFRSGEVHREYFRHKTAIFAKHLKAGTYHYEVELLPRYSGTFTVNPARVEEMYFPVLNGRGEIREVQVE